MEKKTPLFKWHESHGGRMVSFASYSLPVQYETGIITEHNAVRKEAGLFDVSHMGEFLISGKDAEKNLQFIFTNDFSNMKSGQVRYTLLCNEEGGILDDLVVYKMDEDRYMLVVNAANKMKDLAWIQSHLKGSCFLEDVSDIMAQIALQGPASKAILNSISKSIPEKYYNFIEKAEAGGIPCIISRTGYTGEDGFELYCENDNALPLWEKLLAAGKDSNLIPCGLGSRDTLRFEAGMPLYGHEIDETITPFEAGLAFAVKMGKPDFIGKAALSKKTKSMRIRTGLEITGRGIVREKSPVFYQGREIGQTSSCTFCPHLGKAFAMALLERKYAGMGLGTRVEIEVRGRMIEALICKLPFYKREK